MLGKIGPMELMIILGIVALIFGPKQLPRLGRGIGETIREFRNVGREMTEARDEVDDSARDIKRNVDKALR